MYMQFWPPKFVAGAREAELLVAAQCTPPLPLAVILHALVWAVPGAPWHT